MKKMLCLIVILLFFVSSSPAFAYTYQSEDVKLALAMIEKAIQKADCYSGYCISADDAGFWVSVTQDGVAQAIAKAKEAGYDETSESWVASRQEVLGVCESMYNFIRETMGIKNKIFSYYVLDDTNRSNILLVAISCDSGTTIVYDAMAN